MSRMRAGKMDVGDGQERHTQGAEGQPPGALETPWPAATMPRQGESCPQRQAGGELLGASVWAELGCSLPRHQPPDKGPALRTPLLSPGPPEPCYAQPLKMSSRPSQQHTCEHGQG